MLRAGLWITGALIRRWGWVPELSCETGTKQGHGSGSTGASSIAFRLNPQLHVTRDGQGRRPGAACLVDDSVVGHKTNELLLVKNKQMGTKTLVGESNTDRKCCLLLAKIPGPWTACPSASPRHPGEWGSVCPGTSAMFRSKHDVSSWLTVLFFFWKMTANYY